MKLKDIDKLAEAKRELGTVADIERQGRQEQKLGVMKARGVEARAYHTSADFTLLDPALADEELVADLRAAVLAWCGRRRRALHTRLREYGVDVDDAEGKGSGR